MSEATDSHPRPAPVEQLDIPLARDPFLRRLLRHLADTAQEVVAVEGASGLMSIVGQRMGLMTSKVVGTSADEHLGHARVDIARAIARGGAESCVVVYLDPPPEGAERTVREYFKG